MSSVLRSAPSSPSARLIARLSAGLASGLVAVALVPAVPAVAAKGAVTLTSTYTCESPAGSGSSQVRIATSLPGSVKAGSRVKARALQASITVPPELVDYLRQYGVESISGSVKDARYRVGAKKVGLTTVLPTTPVPASGGMTLRGKGRAGAFSIATPGTYAVRIPASFVAKVTARTRSFGDVRAALTCTLAKGAPSKLGSLKVR